MNKVANWQIRILLIGFLLAFGIGTQPLAQNIPIIMRLEFSPDGSKVVGTGNNFLRVWDTTTGEVLVDLQQEISGFFILDVSWNPESTRFATASDSETVQIWSAGEPTLPIGTLIDVITPNPRGFGLVSSVEWSTDGQLLAIGMFNQTPGLQFWNGTDYQFIQEFPALVEVKDVDWHPSSLNLLASVSEFSGARVWDINNPTEYPALVCDSCPRDSEASDTAIAWSNDGTRLAIGRLDGTVMIVNYAADTAITVFDTGNWVMDVTWSSNDQFVATANNAADVQIWNSSTGSYLGKVADNSYATDFNPINQDIVYTDNLDPLYPSFIIPLSDILPSCDITIPATDTTSLISAIIMGNSAGSPYRICLSNSIYTLSAINNSSSDGANGLPVITSDITLVGLGSGAEVSGTLQVSGAGRLTLRNVSVNP